MSDVSTVEPFEFDVSWFDVLGLKLRGSEGFGSDMFGYEVPGLEMQGSEAFKSDTVVLEECDMSMAVLVMQAMEL